MQALKRLLRDKSVLLWAKATLWLILLSLLSHVLDLSKTTVALLFLVLIVVYSRNGVLRVSVALSLLCSLVYAVYFLEPVGKFRVNSSQDTLALLVFLGVAGIVSRIAEQVRTENELAQERQREVERLYELSQSLLLLDNLDELARNIPLLLSRIFGLDAVMLALADSAAVWSSGDCSAIQPEELRQLAYGEDISPLLVSNIQFLPLRMGLRTIGAMALQPPLADSRSRTAIAALVATAVERANAVQRYSQLEAVRAGERLRTALIDSITHELRTPLTSIRAAASMLGVKDAVPDELRIEMASIVEEETYRLDHLIRDAVQMAQLDAKTVMILPVAVTLQEVVEQAVEDTRRKMHDHPLLVAVDPRQDTYMLDREMVRRVLVHLLENAVQHTPAGTHVRLTAGRKVERLVFSVSDDGPGIEDRDLPLIFEKFYRGRKDADKPKGTGMGLAIVRAILAELGGGIEVESRLKQGATFRFWLPMICVEEKATDVR